MAEVHVRLFSLFRERAGTRDATVEVPEPATVQDALDALQRAHPPLADLLRERPGLLLVSVNRTHATPRHPLRHGDEVGVFPPVSGGAGDRALLLLSGGFDSPVAGHLARDQGLGLDAVHYSFEPFTDDTSTRKAHALAAHLGIDRLHVVGLGPALGEVAKRCDGRAYFVLQKRLMVRVADALADRLGARMLVTGENLGQVSSQTLANLAAIDHVARRPVLRPLLGWDKREIIDHARRLGTYETSKGPEVCDVLGPRHPNTAVTLDQVAAEEAKVDPDALAATALAAARVLDTRTELAA